MNRSPLMWLPVAGAGSPAAAHIAPTPAPTALPPVYHAGGAPDQRLHEAVVRARATRPRTPGGRHGNRLHEAAIRAEEKRAAASGGLR